MTREARTSLAIGKVIKMILFIKKNVKEWLSGGPPTSNPVSTAPYLATTHSTLTTCVSHCQEIIAVTVNVSTESVSSIVEGTYQGKPTKLIYGVFTTPENAIGGNAICAFQVLKFPLDLT